jgi:spermidine synthase
MLPFAGTIFISAFLLFQVQPLISRVILPWYGGTPSVWTTCMLFFQAVLLAGYCYAHLIQSLSSRKQAIVHGCLLVFGLVMCWIMPGEKWKPQSVENPIPSILMLLAANVGVPYLIASTTGPLLQAWFAKRYPGTSPYRLYALSNVGSLLALVTYPAFIERYLPLWWQTTLWSIGFVVFVLMCLYCAWRLYETSPDDSESATLDRLYTDRPDESSAAMRGRPRIPSEVPSVGDHFLWVLLSACGSTLFLATTNQMCEDIAVVPFLYILPLGLYLLSFILCFDSKWWYVRPVWGTLLIASALGAVEVHKMGSNANIATQVVVYCLFVFFGCMVVHGELSRLKPAPEYLTAFFLLISCGGMLGGLFVGVWAPNFFDGYWEFPITLVFVFVCFAAAMIRLGQNVSFLHWVGLGVIFVAGNKMFWEAKDFITAKDDEATRDYLFRGRNFFGSLEVYSTDKRKSGEAHTLIHGRIEHGFQWRDPAKRRWKTTYYGDESGIGLAINHHPRRIQGPDKTMRIAMVGLGTGTSACYADKGDVLRFYDINPMVERISRRYFTYREDAKAAGADVDVYLGDARIVMERQEKEKDLQNFDVIGLDAFSSDAIPAHLLTLECMKIYEKHLRDPNEGIIAIHVSNRYLVLERICRALAREMKMTPIKVENSKDDSTGVYTSSWVLLTRNKAFTDAKEIKQEIKDARNMWLLNERALDRVWTDDYYNLFDVVDWSKSDEEIVDFKEDAAKYVRETLAGMKSKFRRMTRQRDLHEWDKKLADEAHEYAQEDAKTAARRAQQDSPNNDLDDVQEGFPPEQVKRAQEREAEEKKDRKKEREAEDQKRAKDRELRHEALLQLKEERDRKFAEEAAEEKADR